MNFENINTWLSILASILGIYAAYKSWKTEGKVKDILVALNNSEIDVVSLNGKKSKQVISKNQSVGIMGDGNTVTSLRDEKNEG